MRSANHELALYWPSLIRDVISTVGAAYYAARKIRFTERTDGKHSSLIWNRDCPAFGWEKPYTNWNKNSFRCSASLDMFFFLISPKKEPKKSSGGRCRRLFRRNRCGGYIAKNFCCWFLWDRRERIECVPPVGCLRCLVHHWYANAFPTVGAA